MPLTAPSTGLGCALDCPLASDAPWIVSWMRLGLLLGVLWTQSAQGRTRPGAFFLGTSSFCLTGKTIPNVVGFGFALGRANVVVSHNGKEDS